MAGKAAKVALFAGLAAAVAAPSPCTFTTHSYSGTSLGGRPVSPADNASQCCDMCRKLPGCEAGGLDPKHGLCYPMANITGWENDPRYVGCVPSGGNSSTGETFHFATKTLRLELFKQTLALKNVTVMVGGTQQGLLHTDDPWQNNIGFPLWRLNVSDCVSLVEFPLTALSQRALKTAYEIVGGALVLRWEGVPLPTINGSVDVEVVITPRPNGLGMDLRGSVSQSIVDGGARVCSHAFALPAFDSMFFRDSCRDSQQLSCHESENVRHETVRFHGAAGQLLN